MKAKLVYIIVTSDLDKDLANGWNIRQIAPSGRGCYVVLFKEE